MDLRLPPIRCRYGAHLSREQVSQLVAPHQDTLDLVYSWLKFHSVPPSSISTSHSGNWLTLTGVPVSQANELLGASYQLYRHTGTNETILRTVGYALPAILHTHVKTVVPTTYFASKRTLKQTPRRRSVRAAADKAPRELLMGLSSRDDDDDDDDDDGFEITPSDLRSLYRTSTYVPRGMDDNKLGVVGFHDEFPGPKDLTKFMEEFRTDGLDATYDVTMVNGGEYDEKKPNMEPNVNIQYTQAIAFPTPHVFYSIGGEMMMEKDSGQPAQSDPYMAWFNYLIKEPNIPKTICIPYGNLEKEIPLEYAEAVCDLFAELGTRGVSIIIASGDYGVGEGKCLAKLEDGSEVVQFVPDFPASCMCSVLFLSLEAMHQAAHHLATDSQVPTSPLWGVRQARAPRSERRSLEAASRTISLARSIRKILCPSF